MSKNACIFDIERFATEDGPGIRTVAFFKGCDLRCEWCHNAEGLSPRPQLLFEPERCIGCAACARVCKNGAHRMENGAHVLDRTLCKQCFACANECFSGALTVSGREMTPQALAEELARDADYYARSGGGITLSGGEVMLQWEAALETLRLLKEKNISTAIETNLDAPWERYARILPYLDVIMFDIKCMNAETHRQYTGVSNERILENAKKLSQTDVAKIVRTPVVAGVNDTQSEIQAIAKHISDMNNLRYYELLRYHPLGRKKYAMLGNAMPKEFSAPDAEKMRELAISAAGICHAEVRIDGKSIFGGIHHE